MSSIQSCIVYRVSFIQISKPLSCNGCAVTGEVRARDEVDIQKELQPQKSPVTSSCCGYVRPPSRSICHVIQCALSNEPEQPSLREQHRAWIIVRSKLDVNLIVRRQTATPCSAYSSTARGRRGGSGSGQCSRSGGANNSNICGGTIKSLEATQTDRDVVCIMHARLLYSRLLCPSCIADITDASKLKKTQNEK